MTDKSYRRSADLRKTVQIPSKTEEALGKCNLSKLALASGVSRETLSRIKNNHVKHLHILTLQRLTKGLLKLGALEQHTVNEMYELLEGGGFDVELAFMLVIDHARTSLRIHEMMVKNGIHIDSLAEKIQKLAFYTWRNMPLETLKEHQSARLTLLSLASTELSMEKQQLYGHLKDIVAGEVLLCWDEVSLIAQALEAQLEDLLVLQPDGKEILLDMMRRTARDKSSEGRSVNQALNKLRVILDLKLV